LQRRFVDGFEDARAAAVTLWDVIEHVNYPFEALQSAANVLKQGGFLLIDTPCRDSFYHQFGAFTYEITGGKLPTFLNAMYSSRACSREAAAPTHS